MSTRPHPEPRAAFPHLTTVDTRWMDNDVYGHVNNVHYYSYFDTVVNRYLIRCGALDIHAGATIGLVVETRCNYFAPIAFPQQVTAGIRVGSLGRSSVRYEIGLFGEDQALCAAIGHFVHVYVARDGRRPVAQLPAELLQALQPLQVARG